MFVIFSTCFGFDCMLLPIDWFGIICSIIIILYWHQLDTPFYTIILWLFYDGICGFMLWLCTYISRWEIDDYVVYQFGNFICFNYYICTSTLEVCWVDTGTGNFSTWLHISKLFPDGSYMGDVKLANFSYSIQVRLPSILPMSIIFDMISNVIILLWKPNEIACLII